MTNEIDIKTERLCSMLHRSGLEAVLINSQHNFSWITGGASNGIDLGRDAGAASILVCSNGRRYLLTNNIEMQRMVEEQVSISDFEPIEYHWRDEKASTAFVLDKAKQLVAGEIAGDTTLESQIAECRYSLTEPERARFRELGRDAGKAMTRTIENVSPGLSEIEIALVLRHEFAKDEIASIVTLVAADERIAKYRHPIPTVNRWDKELLLVICAKRHGLVASLSRVLTVGRPGDDLRQKTDAAAFVHASLLNATKCGAVGHELYAVAQVAYEQCGYGNEIDLHHQGGAAGYRTRDWVAHPASRESVQPYQAFAWNPSITGTKVEETCIVDDGVEIITAVPGQPSITTLIDGHEYHSPGIISI